MDLKIRNIKAATLWGYNAGVRTRYDYTEAMLCNSLFLDYLLAHGLKVHKPKSGLPSTRDIICLDFGFGTRSYEEELAHVNKIDDEELRSQLLTKLEENKDKYKKMSKEELRTEYYVDGVYIDYHTRGKMERIYYRMLYRNPSKAKVGSVNFINAELYEAAHRWLTMDLANRMPQHGAKIVELSAYAPLTTSTIVGKFHMPVENMLILRDQDSSFRTLAKRVVAVENEEGYTHCEVKDGECDVINTLWDGMALIEPDVLPDWCNGMALLRNHFFKACAFKTRIQDFFRDWFGEDYDPDHEIVDMFGKVHKLRDIKAITTDNAIKWKKFADLMGATMSDAYEYWSRVLKADGEAWGIVKTDHPSKLDDVQQMSYQMVNTLPCDSNDIFELADTSVRYVERLKTDDDEFARFLRKNATAVNHYEMMAALYDHNHEFAYSTWFRKEKSKIISSYTARLKQGKIFVSADNLTVCGNPYALLMYAAGGDWRKDPTLSCEEGAIQCYTTRFADGEYLCGIRSPQNSPNNIAYLHNRHSSIMEKYFEFSGNIIAVNCIETDIQSRMNGMDFDSDFMYVSNNGVMVRSAEIAYRDYPTIVNEIPESGLSYDNTLEQYALMDNRFAKAQLDIGESSNVAQLAMTYYWTDAQKEYYDIFVILSVCAQISIDSMKRIYSVSTSDEIRRIRHLDCMKKYDGADFPEFMRYTRTIQTVKNGKDLPAENIREQKDKIRQRINPELHCPMNNLVGVLNTIQRMPKVNTIPTKDFFIRDTSGKAHARQMGKTRKMVETFSYTVWLISHDATNSDYTKGLLIGELYEEAIAGFRSMSFSNKTMNRLIETAIGLDNCGDRKFTKNSIKMLALLYKANPSRFLRNFLASPSVDQE